MMQIRGVSNSDDIIDSRDVIARLAELESLLSYSEEEPEVWDDDLQDELESLKALAEEAEGYAADWQYGEALIRDSYFEDYARQLAEDIGAIKDDAGWPNSYIDWERAAEALQMDYTSVDFDGVTYWIR